MHNHLLLFPSLFFPSSGWVGGGFQGRQSALPITIETHPFEPFLPKNATLLMLGTFSPTSKRWSMSFYYPNSQNDMWRTFGYSFLGDKQHFADQRDKTFYSDALKVLFEEKGVALFDMALHVRRTKNTAFDKDLEIVGSVDPDGLLRALSHYTAVLMAGQRATAIFTGYFGVTALTMGQYAMFSFDGRPTRLYRMPSSSKTYPMKLEKKAESYRAMFEDVLGLPPKKTE